MAVYLNPRDMTGVTVLAQHYGGPLDVAAELLGVSVTNMYRIEQRWRTAGLVKRETLRPVPGPRWVVPRRSVAELLLDHPVRHWMPTPKMADHVTTVLRTRIALAGMDLDRWVSERQLRAEVGAPVRGVKRPHIHDGRYLDPKGQWWAVEVELNAKDPAYAYRTLYAAIEAAAVAHCHGLIYYCRGDAVRNVIRTAADQLFKQQAHLFRGGLEVRMARLETLLSKPPTRGGIRPDLRLVDGGADINRTAL
ncbi:hypothetical protein [Nocardia sp. CC227C]|uniref:hypothetical protein n=1 Tax=Nocardia sp. CC227C TaxID=3044562 RepID=UPI00278C5BD2|nr:hypothetical protein [Nocardia sp. CC227C]